MTVQIGVSAAAMSGAQYAAVVGSGWPLTGRTEELQTITGSVAAAGAPGIVLAGAAGVGKTRLAREALDRARRRGRLCRLVAATEAARSVPLGTFADYATGFGPDPLRRIQEVIDAVTGSGTPGSVVLGVDDAHLLDEQSAVVVHQLVRRRLAGVILTVRTGEAVPDAIRALWKDELLVRLEVQPLSGSETTDLVENSLGGRVESSTAQRIWNHTRGNALYLRQLITDELAAGRITQRSGVWIWRGLGGLSPTLTELVESTIGRQPATVVEVLDVLAVADPVELTVLAAITGPDAIDAAEAAGMITVDTTRDSVIARLAHPLFGEVHRGRAGTMRLRNLRGRVATELAKTADRRDLVQRVRRATLAIDSDLPPDPEQLMDASMAALELMDTTAAERLADAAVSAGGGRRAQLAHVRALVNCDRLGDALGLNSELLATASTGLGRVVHTLMRAGVLIRKWQLDAAEQELEAVRDTVAVHNLEREYNCLFAVLSAMRGRPHAAVDAAIAGLTGPGWTPNSTQIVGILGLVVGLAELGRFDAIPDWAERGYELSRSTTADPMQRFILGLTHVHVCWLAGRISEAQSVADRLAQEPMDHPFSVSHRAAICGIAALARGDLPRARRWFNEAVATGANLESTWMARLRQRELAISLAIAGDHAHAAALLRTRRHPDIAWGVFAHDETLAHAWIHAAAGATSEAVAGLREFARRAEKDGRPAAEVLCLQTAAQFGDPTGADRLTVLTSIVQGPRVTAAAKHAAGLRDRDGDRLCEAAALYEAFGDRIAAADAAAQGAVVFRDQGRRGAAMTATAIAHRLADQTGADTPALRANTTPVPFTPRQREIIGLAATGLSNREIAQRLTMSVRTVEGHLFRASRKTGVNSREKLIALLER